MTPDQVYDILEQELGLRPQFRSDFQKRWGEDYGEPYRIRQDSYLTPPNRYEPPRVVVRVTLAPRPDVWIKAVTVANKRLQALWEESKSNA